MQRDAENASIHLQSRHTPIGGYVSASGSPSARARRTSTPIEDKDSNSATCSTVAVQLGLFPTILRILQKKGGHPPLLHVHVIFLTLTFMILWSLDICCKPILARYDRQTRQTREP